MFFLLFDIGLRCYGAMVFFGNHSLINILHETTKLVATTSESHKITFPSSSRRYPAGESVSEPASTTADKRDVQPCM